MLFRGKDRHLNNTIKIIQYLLLIYNDSLLFPLVILSPSLCHLDQRGEISSYPPLPPLTPKTSHMAGSRLLILIHSLILFYYPQQLLKPLHPLRLQLPRIE